MPIGMERGFPEGEVVMLCTGMWQQGKGTAPRRCLCQRFPLIHHSKTGILDEVKHPRGGRASLPGLEKHLAVGPWCDGELLPMGS